MRELDYIKAGATKAINIDFTMLWPGETYVFVNVNILLEISQQGQVIPSKLGILPYTMSPFSSDNPDKGDTWIAVMRIILLMQTLTSVISDLRKVECAELFTLDSLFNFGMDLALLSAQTYCYVIKMSDHTAIPYHLSEIFGL